MLMIPSLEACKKRKRRSKVYGFHSFGEPGYPILPQGPFRDNIRLFLQQCAELESYGLQGMPIWRTLLVHDNRSLVLPLYTIEENVKTSDTPFCDHCRCTGWSNHFVSKRKYHLIIPMDDDWNKPLDDGILDLSTHLLHGLIHCNGFAHLLCINGLEGGSKHLCAESSWIFGIRSALICEPGKSQSKMSQRSGPWNFACSMELLMGILGLVDGVTNFAMEALGSKSTFMKEHLRFSAH